MSHGVTTPRTSSSAWIDLKRRLAHVEAARFVSAPARILTDRSIGDLAGDLKAADALANWRQWVAQGRARFGMVFCASPGRR